MNYIFVDMPNMLLGADLQTAMQLVAPGSKILAILTSVESLEQRIRTMHPDAILLTDRAFQNFTEATWDRYGVPVYGLISTKQNAAFAETFRNNGIPCYGYATVDVLAGIVGKGAPAMPVSDARAAAQTSSVKEGQQQATVPEQAAEPPMKAEEPPATQTASAVDPSPAFTGIDQIVQDTEAELEDKAKQYLSELSNPAGKRKKKVVSVYSPKGGVGKTTIAVNLAVMLSRTVPRGERNPYKVCLIDANLDFGNVETLLFNNLTNIDRHSGVWAGEINDQAMDLERQRHPLGAKKKYSPEELTFSPEDITYTAEKIESYMTHYSKSPNLSCLLAPPKQIDAVIISQDPRYFECIVRNIKEYGDYDYVIIDLGNNIQDVTTTTMKASDEILVVITQDISAASATVKVFRQLGPLLKDLGHSFYDKSSVRVVINKVRPAQAVGISVQALEDYFCNSSENVDSFPLVATFSDTTAVKLANNINGPLVFNPAHSYTKEMAVLVAEVTGDKTVKAEPAVPKKRFDLSRLFRRRG